MIIHSVAPINALTEEPQMQKSVARPINGGYVEGIETPGGFQLTRLISTDPALYLKKDFNPGSILG